MKIFIFGIFTILIILGYSYIFKYQRDSSDLLGDIYTELAKEKENDPRIELADKFITEYNGNVIGGTYNKVCGYRFTSIETGLTYIGTGMTYENGWDDMEIYKKIEGE